MSGLVWPFRARVDGPQPGADGSGQWRRIDDGQDMTGLGPGEEDVLAIASGTVTYGHDPGYGGEHFGDPYPILTFDSPTNAMTAVYYGHAHPTVREGSHVDQGDMLATTTTPGGGGTPPHWLELGEWDNAPTGNGLKMHDALLSSYPYCPQPPPGADVPLPTDFLKHLVVPDGYWHLRADGTIDRSPGSAWRPHALLRSDGHIYTFPYTEAGVVYEDFAGLPSPDKLGGGYISDIWLTA